MRHILTQGQAVCFHSSHMAVAQKKCLFVVLYKEIYKLIYTAVIAHA